MYLTDADIKFSLIDSQYGDIILFVTFIFSGAKG